MTVLSMVKLATDEPGMANSVKSLSCIRVSDTFWALVRLMPVAAVWIVPPVPAAPCR